ncbi:hypothetical protein F4560_002792 [Saccharothrix ecbatanensis]|uniref:Uncharacterized protein n=1 Tax=Saccharothrix ecbatanensis TaxID=1105145 RepID=A0A7W9M0J7_9PSEU|nr:hypothetical protein [Saccharothrix ecbatanensis]MBB5803024.1 hypothetical protein [Saccharothrix ecbatanensis]
MVVGRFGKMSVVVVAGLLLTGLSGVGSAGAVQQTRVAYSIEFANPDESGDPEPYGAVVLRLADQDRLLWRQGRTEDLPSRWRHPATGFAVEEVEFDEDAVEQVCAYVHERDEASDDQLAYGCLPYRGHYEPYVIEGQDGHVTVNIYGIG